MKSVTVSETPDVAPPPSLLAYGVSYLLIGLVVVALTRLFFKKDTKVGLMVWSIAVVVHHNFDAPLARKLMTWYLAFESRRSGQHERPQS